MKKHIMELGDNELFLSDGREVLVTVQIKKINDEDYDVLCITCHNAEEWTI